jgi:hypothetical protein
MTRTWSSNTAAETNCCLIELKLNSASRSKLLEKDKTQKFSAILDFHSTGQEYYRLFKLGLFIKNGEEKKNINQCSKLPS